MQQTQGVIGRWRRRYISGPVLRRIKALLPPISDTEREALEAGGLWWDAQLLSGKPDWAQLLASGTPRLSDAEQAFLDGPVTQLCSLIDDWDLTVQQRAVPQPIWDFLRQQRFFGMIIPEEFGGLGFSASAHSAVVMRISSRSIAVAVTVMVPNSLGPGELLLHHGTDAQKDYYLPRLADGREIPCFALTSPQAGSDAASMTDRGIVCYGDYPGEQVLGMRVSWAKRYITLGPVATLMGLAFKLHDPDHLLGDVESIGITVALVPTDTPGITIGERHYPALQAFLNGPNEGEDVFMPMDWVLGGQACVGQGWKMLMSALAAGRSISLPSLSVGAGKLAARTTGAYARIRYQFGLPVGRFEGVQEALGRMASSLYLIDAARLATTQALDQGKVPAVVSAILKVQATARMREIINDAMDIHGGKAICDGPLNYLGNVYRAIPVAITVEGANILTRSLIVFGQGAVRCHPYLLDEMEAAAEPDEAAAVAAFDPLLLRHAGFAAMTLLRSVFHGATFGYFAAAPLDAAELSPHYRRLSRFSAALTWVTEVSLLTLGGDLKRREMLSGRLGDVLGELFLLSCALKRFEDDGRARDDRVLLDACMQRGLVRIEQSLHEVIDNFPSKPVSWLLRLSVFPLGRWASGPSDALTSACAERLLTPGPVRDRLTLGVYPGNPGEGVDLVEQAFVQVVATEPLRARLHRADIESIDEALEQKLITQDEAEALRSADKAIARAIEVDAFSARYLGPRAQ
jgi:acyl-CoA dehydrogenase